VKEKQTTYPHILLRLVVHIRVCLIRPTILN